MTAEDQGTTQAPPETAPAALAELRTRLAELSDLASATALVDWDQQTQMPPGGAERRADVAATLGRLSHDRFIDERVGELLDALRDHERTLDHDSDDACLIRVTRRDWEKARRVPSELLAEMAHSASLAQVAWEEARPKSDFAAMRPHLERNVELARRYSACFPDAEHPYDPLLDIYEPLMRTSEVREVFTRLREGLVPLVAAIAERADAVSDEIFKGPFPLDAQRALVARIVEQLGFAPGSYRLDDSAHPFATSLAQRDVRLTNRYDEESLESIFSAIHESGHGLYEQGVDPALERTGLSSGVSMALHESQSRLWENMVGRGRPFWHWALPLAQEMFPGKLDGASPEDAYRAVNVVRPSLIRVDADEVTYCLHVILRFELELELIEGTLAVADLPAVWNERMRSYLGVEVPDDRRGVLQDVHWPAGLLGYFPTYALGNIVAAQLWEAVRRDIPGLDAHLERGEFSLLREWMRERVHRHGRRFTPAETLERAVGGPLDPAPYLAYLHAKHGELYGL